jgi:Periplasmic binding protein
VGRPLAGLGLGLGVKTLSIGLAVMLFGACSSSKSSPPYEIAPATTTGSGNVAPIILEHASGPAGQGIATSTSEALPPIAITVTVGPTTSTSTTTLALPTTPATVATVAPTVAKVVTLPPPTAARVTRAPRTVKPRPTKAPRRTVAPAPTPAPTPSPAPTPTPAPAVAPVATSVVVKPAKAGAACKPAQNGEQRPATTQGTVECRKEKGKWKWRAVGVGADTPQTPIKKGPLSAVAGFDGKTISLGIIGTSTNPTWSNISRAIVASFEARVAMINRRGGVAGKYPIKLVVRDANYDPTLTFNEINATKTQVVGYGSILGTPSTEAVLDLLKQEQLLASPASQDARWASQPNLLPVFNSYQIQAINGVSYFLETAPKAVVCSVSVAGPFGEAGREGAVFAAQDLGAPVGATLVLNPGDTNVAPVLGQLKAAGCQGVMVTTTPQQLLALVIGAVRAQLPFRWIAMGASFSDRLITSQTSLAFEQTCWVVGDGPIWGDGTAELAKELVASNNKYWTENPDVGLTFGFAQARVWEAILERAVARNDLSRAGLLIASREIGTVDLGGLGSPTDYSQPVRVSAPRASVYAVDGSYKNSIKTLSSNYSSPTAGKFRFK